jgi:hypothetical protein
MSRSRLMMPDSDRDPNTKVTSFYSNSRMVAYRTCRLKSDEQTT